MDLLKLYEKKTLEKFNKIIAIDLPISAPDVNQKYQEMSSVVQNYIVQVSTASSALVKKISAALYNDRASHPDLAISIQTKLEPIFEMLFQLQNELKQLKEDYDKSISAQQDTSPIINLTQIHQELGSFVALLNKMYSDVFGIFEKISYVKDNPNAVQLRWESAYLANLAKRFTDDFTNIYKDNSIWNIPEAPKPATAPVAPKVEQPKANPQDPLNLFEEEPKQPEFDVPNIDEFNKANPPKTNIDQLPTKVNPQKPDEEVFNETNSKLTPLPSNNLTEIRGFSLTKPPGARFDIGQNINVALFMDQKRPLTIIGYKRGELHKISYVVEYTTVKGQRKLYVFEPYTGIKPFKKPQGV